MKKQPLFALLVAVAFLFSACDSSSSDDSGVTVGDLTGQWSASSHIFTNNANSAQGVDIIVLGGSTNMTVLSGGRARIWVTLGDFQDEFDAQLSISGSTLTVTPAEASRGTDNFKFTMAGNVLTLTNTQAEFDFTLSGAPETSATQKITFVKQ